MNRRGAARPRPSARLLDPPKRDEGSRLTVEMIVVFEQELLELSKREQRQRQLGPVGLRKLQPAWV